MKIEMINPEIKKLARYLAFYYCRKMTIKPSISSISAQIVSFWAYYLTQNHPLGK